MVVLLESEEVEFVLDVEFLLGEAWDGDRDGDRVTWVLVHEVAGLDDDDDHVLVGLLLEVPAEPAEEDGDDGHEGDFLLVFELVEDALEVGEGELLELVGEGERVSEVPDGFLLEDLEGCC